MTMALAVNTPWHSGKAQPFRCHNLEVCWVWCTGIHEQVQPTATTYNTSTSYTLCSYDQLGATHTLHSCDYVQQKELQVLCLVLYDRQPVLECVLPMCNKNSLRGVLATLLHRAAGVASHHLPWSPGAATAPSNRAHP